GGTDQEVDVAEGTEPWTGIVQVSDATALEDSVVNAGFVKNRRRLDKRGLEGQGGDHGCPKRQLRLLGLLIRRRQRPVKNGADQKAGDALEAGQPREMLPNGGFEGVCRQRQCGPRQ